MNIDLAITGPTAGVLFLATIVHAIGGFGFAQVSMSLLPYIRDPASATILFTVAALFCNSIVFYSVREEFRWSDYNTPAKGLILGLPVGLLFFHQLNSGQLKTAIWLTVGLSIIITLYAKKTGQLDKQYVKKQDNGKPAIAAGFLSGILGGAVAIPSPPMVVYAAYMKLAGRWDTRRIKAMLTAYSGTLMLFRLIAVAYAGTASTSIMLETLFLLPALLLGALIGFSLINQFQETRIHTPASC